MPFALSVLAALASLAAGFGLERSRDEFGVRSHGVVETSRDGRTKVYPLPQSTVASYRRLRQRDLRINPFPPDAYERQEVIGPTQREGAKLWFGKQFYEGEGMRGVGAFGYFDFAARAYTLYSPPQIAPFEISAILVEPSEVWLGLDRFGEDVSRWPGGLACWNRSTHKVTRYPVEFLIQRIERSGEALRLRTPGGYALYRANRFERFAAGKRIPRFPPPPTHDWNHARVQSAA